MNKHFITLLALIAFSGFAFSGNIEEELQKMAQDNAENYIQPFVTAFGSGMNGGLFHTADVHGILGFDVGFRLMGVKVPEEDMTYIFQFTDFPVSYTDPLGNVYTLSTTDIYPSNTEAPTVFGSDEAPTVAPDPVLVRNALAEEMGLTNPSMVPTAAVDSIINNAPSFTVPAGINLEDLAKGYVPVPVPQASVGLPMNTEVLVRFLPSYPLGGFGDINFLGIGVKHQISKYIPLCPVAISAQVVWQKLSLGDIITNTNTAFNVHASKKIPLLVTSITPYIGIGFESSNIDVDYTIDAPGNPLDGQNVSFNLKGDNGFRARVGFSTRILLFKLYADYAIGTYPVMSAGLMLSLR